MINISHIDINVTLCCTNRCANCSHASPFSAPYYMTSEVLRNDLAALSSFVHVRALQLVGGEPLIHPKIIELLEVARESGMADDVLVLTNGMLLRKMPEEFWHAKPSIQVSQYPTLPEENIEHGRAMADKYGFGFSVRQADQFWKQFKPSDGVESFKNCPWKHGGCYTVHEGSFYLCAQSCFFPARFMGLPAWVDGLSLIGITEASLTAFMDRPHPLNACRICQGYTDLMPWHECSTEEQWIKDSTI